MYYLVNQNQRKHILAAHRIIHNVVEKEKDFLKSSSDSEKTADTAKEILFEDDESNTQHLQEKSEEGTYILSVCIYVSDK